MMLRFSEFQGVTSRLPLSSFPFVIEFLHPATREVVHSITVPRPDDVVKIYVPPLSKQLGHPIATRFRFADGVVLECEPPADSDVSPWPDVARLA